jgi:hypothetical protein
LIELEEETEMTEMTAVKSPADLLAEGSPVTAHELAATLLAGPDLPVVVARRDAGTA